MISKGVARLDSLWRRDAPLLRSTIGAFLAKIASVVAALVLNILIGRTLGAEGLGLFTIGLSLVAILSTLSRFGQPGLAVRFGSSLFFDGHFNALGVWIRRWALFAVAGGVAVAAIAMMAENWAVHSLFKEPELAKVLPVMMMAIPLYSLNKVNVGLFKLSRRPSSATHFDNGAAWFAILTILGLIFLIGEELSLKRLSQSFFLAYIIIAGIGLFMLRNLYRAPRPSQPLPMPQGIRTEAFEFMIVQLANVLQLWMPAMLVGVLLGVQEVGLLNAATRCAMLFMFFSVAFGSVIPPRMATQFEQGNSAALGRTARQMSGYMLLASTPLLLIFLMIPGQVLMLFGADFQAGSGLLMILALGRALLAVGTSAQFLLMMAGRGRVLRNITLLATVILFLLSLLLIPHWGVTGVTVAMSFAAAFQAIACVSFARMRMGIWTLPFLH